MKDKEYGFSTLNAFEPLFKNAKPHLISPAKQDSGLSQWRTDSL